MIARLDPDDYGRQRGQSAEQLATARARLLQARSNTEQAQLDFQRTEQLARRNSVSTSELDNARTKLSGMKAAQAAAEADVASAQIGLEQAEANLRYCTLAVPFERSTIASRDIDNNERVSPNQKMFTIVDVSSVVISFNVPDTLVGRLTIGQTVEVVTDALPDRRFSGVMHKIASTADSRTRTYPIEVRIDNPDKLRPGIGRHRRLSQRIEGLSPAADRRGPGDIEPGTGRLPDRRRGRPGARPEGADRLRRGAR